MNIEMFSKEKCSQCMEAVHRLSQQGYTVNVLKLGNDFTRETLLSLFPNARTYPQFRLNGQIIGNFDALQKRLSFELEVEF